MIQQPLFRLPTSYNTAMPFKKAMAEAASECGLSREQIVDSMNVLADQHGVHLAKGNCKQLKIETLDKWLNVNDLARIIDIKALVLFCAVTGSTKPFSELLKPLGGIIIEGKDIKLLHWAQEHFREKAARQKKRKLEAEL
jgi:hypothetical protein